MRAEEKSPVNTGARSDSYLVAEWNPVDVVAPLYLFPPLCFFLLHGLISYPSGWQAPRSTIGRDSDITATAPHVFFLEVVPVGWASCMRRMINTFSISFFFFFAFSSQSSPPLGGKCSSMF